MAVLRSYNAKAASRESYLRRTFGIGQSEYLAMLNWQDGRCAICSREPGAKRFCVDHNHKTGQVRGLLCFRCNYGLTWYSDDARRLEAAAAYIDAPPAADSIGVRVVPPKVPKARKRRLKKAA